MDVAEAVPVLARLLAGRPPRNGAYATVAIDGRGGSGKSTLADQIAEALPDLLVVHGDDYFEPADQAVVWGAFNEDRFDAEILAALRAGDRAILRRPFDFEQSRVVHRPAERVRSGVLVDRCFSFGMDVPWDVRIWVETPRDVCLQRGIDRDGQLWGERAADAWCQVWQPREDEYIVGLDPRRIADLVVDGL